MKAHSAESIASDALSLIKVAREHFGWIEAVTLAVRKGSPHQEKLLTLIQYLAEDCLGHLGDADALRTALDDLEGKQ